MKPRIRKPHWPLDGNVFFRRSLAAAPGRVHFAAHSHHLWPDASWEGHERAWLDAARLADRKWEKIFADVLPSAQRHVARLLGIADEGSTVAFAPNTHELVLRVMSALPNSRPTIVTTSSEFHSFARQTQRLEEDGAVSVVRVNTEPFASFHERFCETIRKTRADLIFVSHVFFDSGWAMSDLAEIVRAVDDRDTFIIIDGYHAFCALPIHLGELASRVFYVGGGYKYAMSGEGVCFMHAPEGYAERPRNTGWFASFGALGKTPQAVDYAPGANRLLGSTFDPSGLYRFCAVMDWLVYEGITIENIHKHVHALQEHFVGALLARGISELPASSLVVPLAEQNRGNFLTYRLQNASTISARLLAHDIVTDVRGDRLRFGFGLYHDTAALDEGIARMARILREPQ